MELRTLKYFLEVAREQNMTLAAKKLHVSQSALSRQMSVLEKELGKELFYHANRKMLLTQDGMHLLLRANQIVTLAERTKTEFQNTDDTIYGEVHIGAGESHFIKTITDAIRRVQIKHPLISFHIHSGNADYVLDQLNQGVIDFGLVLEPINKEPYHYYELPGKHHLGIILRKGDPFSDLDTITPKELSQMTLLASSRRKYNHSALTNWLGFDADNLHYAGSYNLIYNAFFMIESGIGNTIAIDGLLTETEQSSLTFLPLKPKIELSTIFIWKKHAVLSKAGKVFLKEIKNELNHNI